MANYRGEELIACHECDHLHCAEPVPVGAKANCKHCGSLLYRHIPDSLDRSLALYLTALILFVLANSFPFLSLEFGRTPPYKFCQSTQHKASPSIVQNSI